MDCAVSLKGFYWTEGSPVMSHLIEEFLATHPQRTEMSVYDATTFFCDLTRLIGPGFHPESMIEEYISLIDHQPLFTPEQARAIQRLMDQAWEKLSSVDIDPCEICEPVQRQCFL
jgi:hypothetical protein